MNTRNKVIGLVTVLAIGLVTAFLVLTLNKSQQNTEIIVVPNDSLVEIKGNDGSLIKKTGASSLSLKPGNYEITAQKEGFLAKSTQLNISEDSEKQTIVLLLEPSSQEAKDWAQKNNKQYLEAEGRAGELDQISGEKFRSENKITSSLPYNGGFYRIDYGIDRKNNNSFKLVITGDTPNLRQVAIEKIRELGYNPSDYIIEFKGVKNIFPESSR